MEWFSLLSTRCSWHHCAGTAAATAGTAAATAGTAAATASASFLLLMPLSHERHFAHNWLTILLLHYWYHSNALLLVTYYYCSYCYCHCTDTISLAAPARCALWRWCTASSQRSWSLSSQVHRSRPWVCCGRTGTRRPLSECSSSARCRPGWRRTAVRMREKMVSDCSVIE